MDTTVNEEKAIIVVLSPQVWMQENNPDRWWSAELRYRDFEAYANYKIKALAEQEANKVEPIYPIIEYDAPMEGENYANSWLCTFRFKDGTYLCDAGLTKESSFKNALNLYGEKIKHEQRD